ncbi:MAG: OB-fold protein [Archangium sp.]
MPVAAATKPAQAARTVDIRTLLGEYNDNEIRADSTFKGHVIQTSGLVGDVKRDILGDAYITLGVGGPFEVPMVQCAPSTRPRRRRPPRSRRAHGSLSPPVEMHRGGLGLLPALSSLRVLGTALAVNP